MSVFVLGVSWHVASDAGGMRPRLDGRGRGHNKSTWLVGHAPSLLAQLRFCGLFVVFFSCVIVLDYDACRGAARGPLWAWESAPRSSGESCVSPHRGLAQQSLGTRAPEEPRLNQSPQRARAAWRGGGGPRSARKACRPGPERTATQRGRPVVEGEIKLRRGRDEPLKHKEATTSAGARKPRRR